MDRAIPQERDVLILLFQPVPRGMSQSFSYHITEKENSSQIYLLSMLCARMCVYVYGCGHMYVGMCEGPSVCAHVHRCECACKCMSLCSYTCVYACTNVCTYACACMYVCTRDRFSVMALGVTPHSHLPSEGEHSFCHLCPQSAHQTDGFSLQAIPPRRKHECSFQFPSVMSQ